MAKLSSAVKEWISPAMIVGVGAIILSVSQCQYNDLSTRLTALDQKVDSRAANVTTRIDSVMTQQSNMQVQLTTMQSELQYVRGRIDKIAEKLEIAAAEPTRLEPQQVAKNTLNVLRAAGVAVYPYEALVASGQFNEADLKFEKIQEGDQAWIFATEPQSQADLQALWKSYTRGVAEAQ